MRFPFVITLLLLALLPFHAFSQSAKKKKALYQQYVHSGDSAFAAKNYTFAKDQYTQAAALKPDEAYPKERMATCDKEALTQAAKYRRAINAADSCYEKKNWECAKQHYLEAFDIKPSDTYPRDRATTCNYNITAANAMERYYSQAIKRADSCFKARNFTCAKTSYQYALSLRPKEEYPKSRIVECDASINSSVIQEKYNIAISEADQKYDAKDYSGALAKYNEALTYRANEQYPKDRIAACQQAMANAEKDKSFNDAMKLGEQKMAAKDFAGAKSAYEEALKIKPGDATAVKKLAEAEKNLGVQPH